MKWYLITEGHRTEPTSADDPLSRINENQGRCLLCDFSREDINKISSSRVGHQQTKGRIPQRPSLGNQQAYCGYWIIIGDYLQKVIGSYLQKHGRLKGKHVTKAHPRISDDSEERVSISRVP